MLTEIDSSSYGGHDSQRVRNNINRFTGTSATSMHSRLTSVQVKQNRDLERWRKKLADAQSEASKKIEKSKSLEKLMD